MSVPCIYPNKPLLQKGQYDFYGDVFPYKSEQCLFILPVAGNRNRTSGALTNVGSNGNVWSSTASGSNARNVNFNASTANVNSNNRANGFSVRCLKDENVFLPAGFITGQC